MDQQTAQGHAWAGMSDAVILPPSTATWVLGTKSTPGAGGPGPDTLKAWAAVSPLRGSVSRTVKWG